MAFDEDLGRGRIGEKWVEQYLKSFCAKVWDVSGIEKYQQEDIDFLAVSKMAKW